MRALPLALVMATLTAPCAYAGQLSADSRMNIVGNATFDATTATLTTPADLVTGAGDYLSLGTCTNCVSVVTPITYIPFTAVNDLFSVTNNGLTATVSIISEITAPQVTATTLDIDDNATLTLTGFDATPGEFVLTINEFGELQGSFSSTTAPLPVPEPMPIALLGLGMVGLGVLRGAHKGRGN